MKKIIKFFRELDEIGVLGLVIVLFITLVIISHNTNTNQTVCLPKSQLTDLTKSLKTNKLLRGTYNDL